MMAYTQFQHLGGRGRRVSKLKSTHQQFIDGVEFGVGQLKALDLVLGSR